MKDMAVVRYNKKIKLISTVIGAGGVALLIAAVVRAFTGGPWLTIAFWLLNSMMIIFASSEIKKLVEPEDAE